MSRGWRRVVIVALTVAFAAGCYIYVQPDPKIDVWAQEAADFASNEDYYYELCSSTGLTSAQKLVCSEFRDYIANKQKDLEDLIKQNQDNIADLKANIKNQGQKIQQLNDKIDEVQANIDSLDASIAKVQADIDDLVSQIAVRQAKIDTLNDGIKQRMAANQSNRALNSYIKFVMGASSLVDMMRRISSINSITTYDMGKIKEMEDEKTLLQADVDKLTDRRTELQTEQADAQAMKDSLVKLKKQAQALISEYERIEAKLINEIDDAKDDVSNLEKAMEEIDKALGDFYPSDHFYHFVNHSFYVSTGCYYYPNGNFHGAIDAALGSGNAVYAVANGCVVSIGTGCSRGWLGNTCNNGKGNYVMYVCQVGDIVYGVMCQHLSSVNVAVGDVIKGGSTVIGRVGSTGSSTGNHLHIAMYYLKGFTITGAIKYYANLSSRSYYWGLPYNISSACSHRNYNAPCILNPSDYYSIYYGHAYYW